MIKNISSLLFVALVFGNSVAGVANAASGKSVQELISALDDKDEKVRQQTWIELFKIGTDEVVDALIAVMNEPAHKNDKDITNLLGAMKNPKAVAWTKALKDKEKQAHEADRKTIESIGSAGSAAELLPALESSNAKVRLEAAVALGAIGNTVAVKPLLTVLRESAPADDVPVPDGTIKQFRMEDKRFMCLNSFGIGAWYYEAQAVVQIGSPQAVSGVVNILKTGKADQRAIAASVLGRSPGQGAVEPLINALKDPDESVRLCAARSLRSLKVNRAVIPLRGLLADSSGPVRYSAAASLALLSPPEGMSVVAAALNSTDTITSDDAAETLCLMPTTEALEEALPYLRRIDKRGSKAMLVLKYSRSNPQDYGQLATMLKEEDPDIVDVAAASLGRIKDKRAIQALTGLLNDGRGTIAETAATALGNIGGEGVFDVLVHALNSPNPVLRKGVVTGLGTLGDARATDILIGALNDADPQVLDNAVSALGLLKNFKAVPPLLTVLKEKNGLTKILAATSLARLNEPRGVEALLEQLKKESGNERYRVLDALGEFGRLEDIPAIKTLAQSGDWRLQSVAKHMIARIEKRVGAKIGVEKQQDK